MGTPVYAVAIAVSFVSAPLTLLVHLVVAIIYSFEQLRVEAGCGALGSAEVTAEEG